jgi:uncharacterized protein (DUF58 family)
VGGAALNTGNNLLYLFLGLQLGFIIISGILSDSSLWTLRLSFDSPSDLVVHQPYLFQSRIQTRLFPAGALDLEVWAGDECLTKGGVLWIPSKTTQVIPISWVPTRRGPYRITEIVLRSTFPFGFFEKVLRRPLQIKGVVYPAIYPIRWDDPSVRSEFTGARIALQAGMGTMTRELKDYRVGDALRQIHWKASAKRGHWIVKKTDADVASTQIYSVSRWPEETELFEKAISFVASLIVQAQTSDHPVQIYLPNQVEPDLYSLAMLTQTPNQIAPDVQGIDLSTLWAKAEVRGGVWEFHD